MEGRLAFASWSVARTLNVLLAQNQTNYKTVRLMAGKAFNRAAVHGIRPPATPTINIEEVEAEIEKRKQEKEKQIEEVEKKIDSQLNNLPKVSNSSSTNN